MSVAEAEAAAYEPGKPADLGIDLEGFFVDAVRAANVKMDVAGSVTDGNLSRTIDAASQLSVTVHDPNRILLKSQLWQYQLEVEMDDLWYRLVNVQKQEDAIVLNFEDRIVAWLREHKKPLKMSRKHINRAGFVKKMVDEVHADKGSTAIHFVAPELHRHAPIRSTKKQAEKIRRQNRGKGLNKKKKLKLKNGGDYANKTQLSNLERALDVASNKNANRKVMIVMVMVGIQESDWLTSATNGSHVGIFQQDPRYWPATRNVEKDASAYLDASIAADRKNPNLSYAGLAEAVQGSGQGPKYAPWQDHATKIVDEYIGGSGTGSVDRTYAETFWFSRGQPGGPKGESSWDAGLRIAEEVHRRFFVVNNTVYYINDDDLLASKPVIILNEKMPEIHAIDFDWDSRKPINEVTINCAAGRWYAHPGEVVELEDSGPADGKWLVSEINRPLFSIETEITLNRPRKPLAEPAPTLVTHSHSVKRGGSQAHGGVTIAPGANRPGVGLHKPLLDFLALVAGHTSEKIIVTTGTNHNQFVIGTSNQSDHWTGDAADIGVGADIRYGNAAGAKRGDNIATAALVVIGIPYGQAHQWATSGALDFGIASNHNWNGHRVQVGWRTLVGGNHYNHVHIGVH